MAPCAEQAQLTPSGLDKKRRVQFKPEINYIPTTPKCYLLDIPQEILDGILRWPPLSDQQSVAWTGNSFYQKYIPVLQDSSQEFPPAVEDYLLLLRKPQKRNPRYHAVLRKNGRTSSIVLAGGERVRHTKSCTLKFSNDVRLCPCLVMGPWVFLDFIQKLKRDQTIGVSGNRWRYEMPIRNNKTDFQHECTIWHIQHMKFSVSMQISTVSDEQLLVFTEYRIHVWNRAWSNTTKPLHICPHDKTLSHGFGNTWTVKRRGFLGGRLPTSFVRGVKS